MSVCPLTYSVSQTPHVQFLPNRLYLLRVAVARSSSDDSAICYVLLVLWMTTYFYIMGSMGQNQVLRYISSRSPGGGAGTKSASDCILFHIWRLKPRSHQRSTLLPKKATASHEFLVKFRLLFDEVDKNWTCSICFDFVERIVGLVAFDDVASTFSLVRMGLNTQHTFLSSTPSICFAYDKLLGVTQRVARVRLQQLRLGLAVVIVILSTSLYCCCCYTTSPVGVRSIAMSVSVCTCLCSSVCALAYLQKYTSKLHQIFHAYYVWQ